MPITNTLETSRRLTQAGIPAAQAEVFSELFESTAQDAVRELKEFVRAELIGLEGRFRAELVGLEGRLRNELQGQIRAQMLWFFAMLVGLLGLSIAIFKFLP